MRRVMLLYNPAAGRALGRAEIIESIATSLRERGVEAVPLATTHAGSASAQVGAAIARGSDTVFACGGDGTVHDVLQGLVQQRNVALGIIPLGSANVLARHLGLSMNPIEAAIQQLSYEPRNLPVGELRYSKAGAGALRYFLVLAGAGPDGALVHGMAASGKHRLGRLNYYLRAAKLFATGRFRAFAVEYTLTSGETVRTNAVSAMAVRVEDLGGLFSPLIRGGRLEHPHLRLTLVKGPALATLPAWFAGGHLRLQRFNPFAETIDVISFRCTSTSTVYTQADGEYLGTTPMQVRLIPDSVRLLMPAETL